jgi:hypothetical protein
MTTCSYITATIHRQVALVTITGPQEFSGLAPRVNTRTIKKICTERTFVRVSGLCVFIQRRARGRCGLRDRPCVAGPGCVAGPAAWPRHGPGAGRGLSWLIGASWLTRGIPEPHAKSGIPAGAAAHDRGDRQALRSGHPPSLVRAGHVPETVKPYLIAIKRAGPGAAAPRFCRHDGTSCRQEPAQPPIVPAGNTCWRPVFGIRVHAGTGEASGTRHPARAAPDLGTARM